MRFVVSCGWETAGWLRGGCGGASGSSGIKVGCPGLLAIGGMAGTASGCSTDLAVGHGPLVWDVGVRRAGVVGV